MVRVVVVVAILALVACDYSATFTDCTIHCAADMDCPDDFQCDGCSAQGCFCRSPGETTTCAALAVDASGAACLTYFDDADAFALAAGSLSLTVEDFSRTANGSPTPNAFVIQNGDYFFWHARVTFGSVGVNETPPGARGNAIAVGGAAVPSSTTIMPQLSATARDAIVATFSTDTAAVALRPSDDEGAQAFFLEVVTSLGIVSFPVASAQAPFVGIVSTCGNVIESVTLSPPMPSQWWRLSSVTFAP